MDKLPEIASNKRIVLQHTSGPYAGMFQIIGHSDYLEGRPLPTNEVCDIWPHPRKAAVSLAKIAPRYALYREETP